MKKNLISIIILALLIVNIALTAVMMFSVVPANNKAIALITDVAAAMELDLSDPNLAAATAEKTVSVEDTVTYDIPDQMTISMRKGEDGKDHYAIVSVSLCMDSKSEDYKKYGADIASTESMIKNEINDAIGSLTYEEAQVMTTAEIQDAVLKKIQAMYGSAFIYKVVFRDIMFS